MPFVSVIIPNYNHAHFLQQRIESVLNQTLQDFEVIILDDASSDDSRDIIERYKHNPHVAHIVYNEKNGGSPFKQWNKGIELAQGEWIWIAESDDYAEPKYLEKLLEQSKLYPTAGFIYCLHNWVDEKGKKLFETKVSGSIEIYEGEEFIVQHMLYENGISNVSNTLFRKELYYQIDSSLYQQMKLCGDWFFYVLLLEHTDILAINQVYNNYRLHSSNVSSQAEIEGASCIEGAEILNHITKTYHLNSFDYSLSYARRWLRLKSLYKYSHTINSQIKRLYWSGHKQIVIGYYLLRIYRFCKRTIKLGKH